ncbi:hypothetical protein F2Q69_00009947 [Brassica cretica]|uniref:Uncharacterized protein n=1 Tax=Brassica cretica TaxID=69181 RepID=A0A8S9PFB2_BRACR|nr:hypothetical protein F2Q69_00009947 [Brassica cretica]
MDGASARQDPYFRDESNDEEEMEINTFRIEEASLTPPNKDIKHSQRTCFLGKIKFSDFVGRHIVLEIY